jgi:hypothetical protein
MSISLSLEIRGHLGFVSTFEDHRSYSWVPVLEENILRELTGRFP